MECYVCGRSPESFAQAHQEKRRLISEALDKSQREYKRLLAEIAENEGYTEAKKEALRALPEDVKHLLLSTVMANPDFYIAREKPLSDLVEYAKAGASPRPRSSLARFQQKTDRKTVGDLVSEFLQEPKPERYRELATAERDTRSLQEQLDGTPETEDFRKVMQRPPHTGHSNDSKPKELRVNKMTLNSTVSKFVNCDDFNAKYSEGETVVLCPTCNALFQNAASAAHLSDPYNWE